MAAVTETTTAPLRDPDAEGAIESALAAISAPGSFFTGAERLAMAAQTRVARGLAETGPDLDPVVAEAVARVAASAMTSRKSHVQAWVDSGRDVLAYVELVSVVAQTASIDSYRIGLDVELNMLPGAVDGAPAPEVADGAAIVNAWVPTVGVALAPTALSALPREKATKAALGAAWYITDEVIHQYDVEPGRELTRPQMELVAARTSWLNECFF
ncbi:MAG: hypothetical protein OXM54_08590 [Acidimicrobiaceae bacterium]|nr:hypothetical protein [Acidimicrobiaceae bacterium]